MISAVCRWSLCLCVRVVACLCVCMCLLHSRTPPCTLYKQVCINVSCKLSVVQALQHQLALLGAICPATSLPHTCSAPPSSLLSGYKVKCIRPLLTDTDVALQKWWQPFYSRLHTHKHTYPWLAGWESDAEKDCVCHLHSDTMWCTDDTHRLQLDYFLFLFFLLFDANHR